MKRWTQLIACTVLAGVLLWALQTRFGSVPPIGTLLDPVDGVFKTARLAHHEATTTLEIDGLAAPVEVIRDERGVPHIYAQNDADALKAMGYVVAQDRLFQLDFIPRVASGRLAEAFGAGSVGTDRFLRRTGMDWAAPRILEAIEARNDIEYDIMEWYSMGVNAYLDTLDPSDLPLEFRLLGYTPDRYSPLQMIRLLQYMTFDLTYNSDDAEYAAMRQALTDEEYNQLFPEYADLYVPIIPETGGMVTDSLRLRRPAPDATTTASAAWQHARDLLAAHHDARQALKGTAAEGYVFGKGSNNWGVNGSRSATGMPILADDMHLALSLPAIWYEVHLVTPTRDVYGVTLPGAPAIVVGYNDHIAWGVTNTGADQIDHYALTLDDSGTRYLHNGQYKPLEEVIVPINVNGGEAVADTLYYSHWGPTLKNDSGAVAIQWVGHKPTHTLRALWGINEATSYGEMTEALVHWGNPMQNILAADVHGNLGIRSTGYWPIRQSGTGAGLLDGATDSSAWVGRLPLDQMPSSLNPEQGFLTSTNQQPADRSYPHYQNHDWSTGLRSLRADSLFRGKDQHTVDDLKAYHGDVRSIQHALLRPLLRDLSRLDVLTPAADSMRLMLLAWDGETDVESNAALLMDEWMDAMQEMTWDEPVFEEGFDPAQVRFLSLLLNEPSAKWFDIQLTIPIEDGPMLAAKALNQTAETMHAEYGRDPTGWRWGDHHKVLFRHLTQSGALRPLWRGPYEYPGFSETLSPASARTTTFSASWRMVVDLSQTPPVGYGVYPGGQSGNPFSRHYADFIPMYLDFDHYTLSKPATADAIPTERRTSTLRFMPEDYTPPDTTTAED
ncbi:MAG: penicillin acylase family protein [Bacteroidota bacterium]